MRGSVVVDLFSLASRGNYMDSEQEKTKTEEDAPPMASGDSSPQFEDAEMMEEELLKSPTSTTSAKELEDSIEKLQLKEKKAKLSGAARKRFKWLIKSGLSPEEAREKAFQPMGKSSNEKGTKRARSDGSTPETVAKKHKPVESGKTNSGEPTPLGGTSSSISFKQAVTGIKIGVLHKGFPNESLNTEQLKLTQESILNKILEGTEGPIKPKFLGTTFKAGWLAVHCADKATAEWLKDSVPQLKPWPEANLIAGEEKDLPKSSIVNAYFPNSTEDKNDYILKLVKGQNEGLNTSEWRVLHRKEEGTAAHLTMSVDPSSWDSLKKTGFKISYKFGQITVRQRTHKPHPKSSLKGKELAKEKKPCTEAKGKIQKPQSAAKAKDIKPSTVISGAKDQRPKAGKGRKSPDPVPGNSSSNG